LITRFTEKTVECTHSQTKTASARPKKKKALGTYGSEVTDENQTSGPWQNGQKERKKQKKKETKKQPNLFTCERWWKEKKRVKKAINKERDQSAGQPT